MLYESAMLKTSSVKNLVIQSEIADKRRLFVQLKKNKRHGRSGQQRAWLSLEAKPCTSDFCM